MGRRGIRRNDEAVIGLMSRVESVGHLALESRRTRSVSYCQAC